jgi:hypothetical protein
MATLCVLVLFVAIGAVLWHQQSRLSSLEEDSTKRFEDFSNQLKGDFVQLEIDVCRIGDRVTELDMAKAPKRRARKTKSAGIGEAES